MGLAQRPTTRLRSESTQSGRDAEHVFKDICNVNSDTLKGAQAEPPVTVAKQTATAADYRNLFVGELVIGGMIIARLFVVQSCFIPHERLITADGRLFLIRFRIV